MGLIIELKENLGSSDIAKILKQVSKHADSNASLMLGVQEAFRCELINQEIFRDMRDVLYEKVGADGWRDEWDM
ncbi:hypothetical protein [Tenacibaculum finnmarkense]|uniref:hypothetical protein n=1 Tax=Tenacibaculum finnmarkense TaxID=2781243 RepID=UPI00187BC0AA|nr:hypothetical protein [Tenacibaculum finnmarkense]MBE7688431.1 hypothetical protein [Tenacibaculum finnmarkense genomovar ulcerans]MCG8734619.1 hypothetical protein [Tenacibaculum finnmarkense]